MQQNLDSELNQIREVGYCVIEAALQADVINAVKHALLPWFGRQRMGRNNFEGEQTERVYALLDKDPVFALIVEHEAVLAIVNKLLEPTYLLSANLAINIHPTETPQPFHADHASVPNCPRNALNGVSTIWAMDDFTQANGATQVVPGSHLWRTQKPIKDEMLQTVVMSAGSVLVFHGSLIHRGGANQSNATRLAITPQYCQPWLRQLESMLLAISAERAASYSPRLQALLGYSIREPGFMGYVDGMHPKRLIDAQYKGRHLRGKSS